jgi:protein pelota
MDTKAFSEVRALDAFFEMLNTDADRAYYGYDHVKFANEQKAIDTLLVTDELFRSSDMKTRREYVQLVESVKENGGDVKIFSTLHVSGERQCAQDVHARAVMSPDRSLRADHSSPRFFSRFPCAQS